MKNTQHQQFNLLISTYSVKFTHSYLHYINIPDFNLINLKVKLKPIKKSQKDIKENGFLIIFHIQPLGAPITPNAPITVRGYEKNSGPITNSPVINNRQSGFK